MRKFLHPGVNMVQNTNGDYVIQFDKPLVTITNRTYNSVDEYLKEVHEVVFNNLTILIQEAQELHAELSRSSTSFPGMFGQNSVPGFNLKSGSPSNFSGNKKPLSLPEQIKAIEKGVKAMNNADTGTGTGTGFGQYDKEHRRRFIYEPEEDDAATLPAVSKQKTDNKKAQKPVKSVTGGKTAKKTNQGTVEKKAGKTADGKTKKKNIVSNKTKPVIKSLTDAEIKSYLDKANASSTGFSNEYLTQLVILEGITLKIYDDDGSTTGNATIGIGNMIHTGMIGNTDANKKLEEPYKNGITLERAFSDFVGQVNQMSDELKSMLKHADIKADKELFGVFFDIYWNGEGITTAIAFYKDAGIQGLLAGLNAKPVYWNKPAEKDSKHKAQINRLIKSPNQIRKDIKVNELEKRADLYDKAGDIENLKINKNDEDTESTA